MHLNGSDWDRISGIALFEAMPEDVVRRAVSARPPIHLKKGETLFQRGDRAEACFVILDGWIKLFRLDREGTETVIEVFAPGECFAEAVMLAGEYYPVHAEAATDARLAYADGDIIREEIRRDPEVAFSMLSAMSVRLHRLVDHIEQIKARNASERLAHFFLRFCPETDTEPDFHLPFTKSLLASRLGIKPESLSRALVKLRDQGVSVHRDHVHIADRDRLAAYVELEVANPSPVDA